MSVAHQAAPPVLVHEPGMGGEERLDLGLDRLRQHPPGALAQHRQQRIVHDVIPFLKVDKASKRRAMVSV